MRNRIRELRTARGWSQDDLAALYGTSQQHIQRMEAGQQRLNTDHMERLGTIFEIDPLEILVDPSEQPARAPVLDEIQAGAFAEAAGDIERHDLRGVSRWVRVEYPRRTIFALQVRGDSMDRVVPEGGIVIVDYSIKSLEDGDLGVFRVDGAGTFKRLRRTETEEYLEPDSNNPRHTPIFGEQSQMVEIIGRVVRIQMPDAPAPSIQPPKRSRTRRTTKIGALAWFLCVLAGATNAQSRLDGANLLVDIRDHIGKEVILTGGKVFGADNSGALVRSGGATFKLSTEEIDKETFRFFLKNCSGITMGDGGPCTVSLRVTPTGKQILNNPILKAVKLTD